MAPDVLPKITVPWQSIATDKTVNCDATENFVCEMGMLPPVPCDLKKISLISCSVDMFSQPLCEEHFGDIVQTCWEYIKNYQMLNIHFGRDIQETGESMSLTFLDC